ncbi:PilZ domain-containing protein [Myxococcota bacterium]
MLVGLDIQHPELRKRAIEALDGVGLQWTNSKQASEPITIELRDLPLSSNAKVVVPTAHVWEHGRHPKDVGRKEGNPFEESKAVYHLIGALPKIDPWVLESTLAHLETGKFLGLTSLLSPRGEIEVTHETRSTAKPGHLAKLREFLERHQIVDQLQGSLEDALEELFDNAAYDAPTGPDGTHTNASKSRGVPVQSERPFVVTFGIDDDNVGIAVRDYYGSLTLDRVTDRLQQCYARGGAQYEDKRGGAGLGLFLLLQVANRLIINTKSGQFTEVVIMCRREERMRTRRMTCPSLNICAVTGEQARATSRRHFRMPTSWVASLDSPTATPIGVVRDVSAAGAFIELTGSRVPPLKKDPMPLVFAANPSHEPLRVSATVVWRGLSTDHRCQGVGVRFIPALNPLDVFGNATPVACDMRGERTPVEEIQQTWVTGGQHSGDPVKVFFKVRAEGGQILILRHDTLRDLWAAKAK